MIEAAKPYECGEWKKERTSAGNSSSTLPESRAHKHLQQNDYKSQLTALTTCQDDCNSFFLANTMPELFDARVSSEGEPRSPFPTLEQYTLRRTYREQLAT